MDLSDAEVLIFANPIAGRGRGRQIASSIAGQLRRAGMAVRQLLAAPLEVPGDQLITSGASAAVVCVGGDGTLRAAAQRLLSFHGGDASRVPPILVVPLGTANLMARHLGLSISPDEAETHAVSLIQNRRTALLDAATANGELFLLMAGVGLDAGVIHELDRMRRGPIDITSYALPVLNALRTYEFPPLRVEVDGKVIFADRPGLAFVGNVKEYGTGFPILSLARSDDRLLDVCVMTCRSQVDVLRLAMLATTGEHLREDGVVYVKGRSIRIDAAEPVPVQIDGEASGFTPLRIELLPSGLRFIVG